VGQGKIGNRAFDADSGASGKDWLVHGHEGTPGQFGQRTSNRAQAAPGLREEK
jgi:hypothetical protein